MKKLDGFWERTSTEKADEYPNYIEETFTPPNSKANFDQNEVLIT